MAILSYIGDIELGYFVSNALKGSGIVFQNVAENTLSAKTPGDVFVTERTVRFAPNTPAISDIGEIVSTVRETLRRSVPMIILVNNQTEAAKEIASLFGVRVVQRKKDLPEFVYELLNPNT